MYLWIIETRPSILCVTQKRAFMPLYIVLGQHRACMPVYIGKSGHLVRWHRCLTDRQTTEYSATQLLYSIQFKLSHAIFWTLFLSCSYPFLQRTTYWPRRRTSHSSSKVFPLSILWLDVILFSYFHFVPLICVFFSRFVLAYLHFPLNLLIVLLMRWFVFRFVN